MYNPYDNFMYQNMYRQQIQGTRFVDGLAGARNCVTPPNSKTILMDNNEDKFYIKETDMNGVSTISQYRFSKIEDEALPNSNYVTKEEFEKWKEHYESIIEQSAKSTLQRQQQADIGPSAPIPENDAYNPARSSGAGAEVSQGQFRFS